MHRHHWIKSLAKKEAGQVEVE
jgi:cell envelope opacity-associated protein A